MIVVFEMEFLVGFEIGDFDDVVVDDFDVDIVDLGVDIVVGFDFGIGWFDFDFVTIDVVNSLDVVEIDFVVDMNQCFDDIGSVVVVDLEVFVEWCLFVVDIQCLDVEHVDMLCFYFFQVFQLFSQVYLGKFDVLDFVLDGDSETLDKSDFDMDEDFDWNLPRDKMC